MPVLGQALDSAQGPLGRLLKAGGLRSVFQPIVSLASGDIQAHEALIRGPAGTAHESPLAMIEASRAENLREDFETLAVWTALDAWAKLRPAGRLFVNLSADVLVLLAGEAGFRQVQAFFKTRGLDARSMVVEITEHERVSDVAALAEAVQFIREAGWQIALDDFGDGHSSLRLWSQLKPDFVKIDKFFTRDIGQHAENLQTIRALQQIGEVFDTQLIAEGVETAEDYRVLRDLGIPLAQGFFLGRPAAAPATALPPAALAVANDSRIAVLPELTRAPGHARARTLPFVKAAPIAPSTTNETVARRFHEALDLHALPIVQEGAVVGLIGRLEFLNRAARPYFMEVFGRQPCLSFANEHPLVIDVEPSVEDLHMLLTSADQRFLRDGFVVTKEGRYHGVSTGEQLVRIITEIRIESARHANPLTFLPGNIPITQHIERLLDARTRFAACYVDLNHFKPFNDRYGYWRGDEVIKLIARICLAHCDAVQDFLGHVGGDDFIILFQSNDWTERCHAIHRDFSREVMALFDPQERLAGGFAAEDRDGVTRFFPLTSVAIGGVLIEPGAHTAPEQIATLAAKAKHEAKQRCCGLHVL